MKLRQRWKQTAIHNKALVFTGAIGVFGTLLLYIAAQKQDIAAQKQFRLDQRAWISVIKGSLIKPLDAKKISLKFVVKNSGKTPALRVRVNHKAWIQSATGQILTKNETTNNREVSYGPGDEQPIYMVWKKPISQQQIDDMQSGKVIFFVEVELIYYDIYDDKKPHRTRACFYYNPKVEGGGVTFCENGSNYMD